MMMTIKHRTRWTAMAMALLLAMLSACAQPGVSPGPDEAGGESAAVDALSGASEKGGETQAEAVPPQAAQNGADAVPVARDSGESGLYTRTTARAFADIPLDEEQIGQLVRAAFASPTGGGQRCWEFIVVTDREVMRGIKEGHPFADALDSAPLVIVVAADENSARYPELLALDSGIATQSILVQAAELGLASVPMSIAPQEERVLAAVSALALPDGVIPHIMIAIGYPATDAVSSASVDYYSESKVHYNGF